MMTLIALIYFGGIDPGSLKSTLKLSADQSTMDIEAQNNLISELTEITSRTDQICSKIDTVLNSIIKKDVRPPFLEPRTENPRVGSSNPPLFPDF